MTETQLLLVLSVMNINIINYKTVVQQQITRNSIKKTEFRNRGLFIIHKLL